MAQLISISMPMVAILPQFRQHQGSQDLLTDISHIRLRVSKEPAILHDGDGRGIHERRQLSHRAHKTISRCRELASARQRRQLPAGLHTLVYINVHRFEPKVQVCTLKENGGPMVASRWQGRDLGVGIGADGGGNLERP